MNQNGFLASLFDLSFSHFITLKLIKVLFVLNLLFAAVAAMAIVGAGFTNSFLVGLLSLVIGAPIAFLAVAMVGRIYLEIVAVVFRGAESLRAIEENTRRVREGVSAGL